MSKRCEFCDKGTVFGNSISHAHNVTNRSWKANLQRVRAFISGQSPALLRFSGESATLLVYSAGYKTVRLKIQRGQRTISLVLRKK